MPAEPPVESPASLADAYRFLSDDGIAWRPVAGGTDLLVQITGELGPPPERVLDIWALDELRGINLEGDELVIGALTTYTDLRTSALVAELLPALTAAAATIGAAQIQNRGTMGATSPMHRRPATPCRSGSRPTPRSSSAAPRASARWRPTSSSLPIGLRHDATMSSSFASAFRCSSPPPRPVPKSRHAARAGHQQGRARPVLGHGRRWDMAGPAPCAGIGGSDADPRT